MANKLYSVYYLLDPRTNQVRYVGCSCRPSARLEDHLKARGESHRARWQRLLLAEGLLPVFVVKCIVQTEEEMFRIEMALIAMLRTKGESLTNMTAGGDGLIDPLPEIRAKRSASAKMRPKRTGWHHTEASKQKSSESRKHFNIEHPEVVARVAAAGIGNKYALGYSHTDEAKQRMADAKLCNTNGAFITDAGREAKRVLMTGNLSRTGMTNSAESNARRSASCSSFWTEERRAEKAISQLGKTHSEESKAKNAESARRMWARRKLVKVNAALDREPDSFDPPTYYQEDMTQ